MTITKIIKKRAELIKKLRIAIDHKEEDRIKELVDLLEEKLFLAL